MRSPSAMSRSSPRRTSTRPPPVSKKRSSPRISTRGAAADPGARSIHSCRSPAAGSIRAPWRLGSKRRAEREDHRDRRDPRDLSRIDVARAAPRTGRRSQAAYRSRSDSRSSPGSRRADRSPQSRRRRREPSPARPINVPSSAKIRSIMASSAPIALRIAMSLDFSMIIIMSVVTITNAATTMIIVSSRNIITRSVLSAWKKAGKDLLPVARVVRIAERLLDQPRRRAATGSGRSSALRSRR